MVARLGIVVLTAFGLAWLTVNVSMANALREDDPRAALRWLPVHARAMADFADQRLQQGRLSADDAARITRLATEAIRRDPTTRVGWRVLATLAALQRDRDREARIYAAADRVSRRDPLVQTWYFSRMMAAGNHQEALRRADVAMTVSPSVRRALLPALRLLNSDERILRQLVALVISNRPWSQAFFYDLAHAPPPPEQLLRLLELLPADVVRPHHDLLAGLVAYYANAEPENALRLYRYVRPSEDGLVRNGSFAGANDILPFVWELADSGPVVAEQIPMDGRADQAALLVTGRSGFGPAARQRVVLSPGRYRWLADVGKSGLNAGSLILRIRCGTETSLPPIFDARITPSGEDGERASGNFELPKDRCSTEPQWLEIGIDRTGSSVWIDDLAIVRVSN